MFKKALITIFLLPTLFISTSYAHVYTLTSFNAVQDAIDSGYDLNFVVNISECKGEVDKNHQIVSSFKPTEVLNVKNRKVSVSTTHFTMNHPKHKNTPVYQYINYQLMQTGAVHVNSTVLSANKKLVLGEPVHFDCTLNQNTKIVTNL